MLVAVVLAEDLRKKLHTATHQMPTDTLSQHDRTPVPCRMTAAVAAAVMGKPVAVAPAAAAVAAKKPTAAAAALTNSSGSTGHVRLWQPWRWRRLLLCRYHWRKTPAGVSQQQGLVSV